MKKLHETDFKDAYGDVPASFSRSVQAALRQTKEERVMKRFSIHTALVFVAVMIALAAVAVATGGNNTENMVIEYHGSAFAEQLSDGGTMLACEDVIELDYVNVSIPEAVYYNGTIYGTLKIDIKDPERMAMLTQKHDAQWYQMFDSGKQVFSVEWVKLYLGKHSDMVSQFDVPQIMWEETYDYDGSYLLYYFEFFRMESEDDPVCLTLKEAEEYKIGLALAYHDITGKQDGEWFRPEERMESDWLTDVFTLKPAEQTK